MGLLFFFFSRGEIIIIINKHFKANDGTDSLARARARLLRINRVRGNIRQVNYYGPARRQERGQKGFRHLLQRAVIGTPYAAVVCNNIYYEPNPLVS